MRLDIDALFQRFRQQAHLAGIVEHDSGLIPAYRRRVDILLALLHYQKP